MGKNVTREEAISCLESPETSLDTIYELFLAFPKDAEIESNIAMALSLRTSIYDRSKGAHPHMVEMLETLVHSEDMQARWAVAKNPHTPSSLLELLGTDEINLVRALVATNPDTPSTTLRELFNDEVIVRIGLTGNPSTPSAILKLFIHDNDRMARLRVAENPAADEALLKQLCEDDDKDVRIAAKKRLGIDYEDEKKEI